VRGAAFEQDVRLDIGKTAGRIEQPANRVTGVQQQQGMWGKGHDINRSTAAELQRRGVGGEDIIGRQWDAIEPRVHTLVVPDADMNFAALQQRHLIHPKSARHIDYLTIETEIIQERYPEARDWLDRDNLRRDLKAIYDRGDA
jgi:hypothetical protein